MIPNKKNIVYVPPPYQIVLKNNFFEFYQKTFKQVHGTATGTKLAPPYAIFLWLT